MLRAVRRSSRLSLVLSLQTLRCPGQHLSGEVNLIIIKANQTFSSSADPSGGKTVTKKAYKSLLARSETPLSALEPWDRGLGRIVETQTLDDTEGLRSNAQLCNFPEKPRRKRASRKKTAVSAHVVTTGIEEQASPAQDRPGDSHRKSFAECDLL